MIEFVYPHTQLVAGVDEVGRGPLVGAVVTAARNYRCLRWLW